MAVLRRIMIQSILLYTLSPKLPENKGGELPTLVKNR
jgi:hypothetical protein